MEARKQFNGIVSGVRTSTVCNGLGTPVTLIGPELEVEVPGMGSLFGMRFTSDVDEACALVGRKVRVTVEVLEEGGE